MAEKKDWSKWYLQASGIRRCRYEDGKQVWERHPKRKYRHLKTKSELLKYVAQLNHRHDTALAKAKATAPDTESSHCRKTFSPNDRHSVFASGISDIRLVDFRGCSETIPVEASPSRMHLDTCSSLFSAYAKNSINAGIVCLIHNSGGVLETFRDAI